MSEQMLVKVIATVVEDVNGRMVSETARGFSPIDGSIVDFISDFMKERNINQYSIHHRGDSYVTSPIVLDDPRIGIMLWHFVKFPISEFGHNAKDLSKEELERDIKSMKKASNKWQN